MTLKKIVTICAVTAVLSAATTLGLIYCFKTTVCLLAAIATTALFIFILDIFHPRPKWFFISEVYMCCLLIPFILLLFIFILSFSSIYDSSRIFVSRFLLILIILIFMGYTIAVVYSERKNSLFWLRAYAAVSLIFLLATPFAFDISEVHIDWPSLDLSDLLIGLMYGSYAISLIVGVLNGLYYTFTNDFRRKFPKTQLFNIDNLTNNTSVLLVMLLAFLWLCKVDIYLTFSE